jgi:epidermal growth factor receptor substrate 15
MHRDLADLNNDGRLTRDGFAVAFHLIQGKLFGKEIPTTLPASLMPPSMRAATAPSTSPFQQPLSDSLKALKDLLWEDSPVTSQPQSGILQPQRTGQTQSPAISASHTQGQITFGMSQLFFKERKVYGLL